MKIRWRDPVSEPISIAFAGDIRPDFAENGGTAKSAELVGLLGSCKLVMVNLESALTTADSCKTIWSSLYSPPSSVMDLKELNVSLANVANNHIMDRGQKGLTETFDTLYRQGLGILGAGHNAAEAARPFLWECEDKKIAFLASSYEASDIANTAGESTPGANSLTLEEACRQISSLKEKGYTVCYSFHGGTEFFRFPCPRKRVLFRELAESGADIVIGHHSHVLQGVEVFGNRILAHSLGNFFMTTPFQLAHKGTDLGLLLLVEIDSSGPIGYSVRFVHNDRSRRVLSLLGGEAESKMNELFRRYSGAFEEETVFRKEWRRDCCRFLFGLNERKRTSAARRLFEAAKRSWSGFRREEKAPDLLPENSGGRHACTKREIIREGIRGLPLLFREPKTFVECYRTYEGIAGR